MSSNGWAAAVAISAGLIILLSAGWVLYELGRRDK